MASIYRELNASLECKARPTMRFLCVRARVYVRLCVRARVRAIVWASARRTQRCKGAPFVTFPRHA
jgi:hypothetical protein